MSHTKQILQIITNRKILKKIIYYGSYYYAPYTTGTIYLICKLFK